MVSSRMCRKGEFDLILKFSSSVISSISNSRVTFIIVSSHWQKCALNDVIILLTFYHVSCAVHSKLAIIVRLLHYTVGKKKYSDSFVQVLFEIIWTKVSDTFFAPALPGDSFTVTKLCAGVVFVLQGCCRGSSLSPL